MFITRRIHSLVLALLLLGVGGVGPVASAQPTGDTRGRDTRIVFFGSSVPNGTGDETRQEGYTGRVRQLLEPAGWDVVNRSRGGANTVTIALRFEPEGTADPNTP